MSDRKWNRGRNARDQHELRRGRTAASKELSHASAAPSPPRFLDRVRAAIRVKHYSVCTEKAYVSWIKRFIFFHDKRHPNEMGAEHVAAYISQLATEERVSASTQNQALSAIIFLYRYVLERELDDMEISRAKSAIHLPVVLSREEAAAVLGGLDGVSWLRASLMYGSGLRVLEACRLRVKDIDFYRREIMVRNGKGEKDRVTMMPRKLVEPLQAHLDGVRRLHKADLDRARDTSNCRTRCDASTPAPRPSGVGSGSRLRRESTRRARQTSAVVTSFTKASSNAT